MSKALVLSSGGVDSTTCLAMAVDKYGKDNVATVIIRYGQRHEKEVDCAKKIAEHYGVKHYEFDLTSLFQYSHCSLIKEGGRPVEETTYEEQFATGEKISSYVPFRNGLMLSVCATLAQSLWEKEECDIYLGNHSSDFAYADCSVEFVEKMDKAISEGTYGLVHFVSPLKDLTKDQVVKIGLELNVPYELTWSCYEGTEVACGKCASCLERIRSFEENGVKDPIPYANEED